MERVIEEPVRVLFHLDGGYTKLIYERTEGVGLADFGISVDVPTAKIPIHLRKIGSRFIFRKRERDGETEIIDLASK